MSVADRIRQAAKPAFIHLCLSALVSSLAFVLVFYIWFPAPFDTMLAGRELFWLIFVVDLVCGPLLTGVVFDRRKPRKELIVDLSVIGLLQLAALFYGLWSVQLGRPVVVVFEVDRFRVVTQAEVWHDERTSPPDLPFFSIKYVGVLDVSPSDPAYLKSLDLSLNGIPLGVRRESWVPFERVRDRVRDDARDVSELLRRYVNSDGAQKLTESLRRFGLSENEVGYWPVQSRRSNDWIALVGRTDGEVKAYLQLDPW